MNNTQLIKELKQDYMNAVQKFFEDRGDEIYLIGNSEFCIPCLDAERNERYVTVKVTVPRGVRAAGGFIPFNGEEAAENYKIEQAEREGRKRARGKKKNEEEEK